MRIFIDKKKYKVGSQKTIQAYAWFPTMVIDIKTDDHYLIWFEPFRKTIEYVEVENSMSSRKYNTWITIERYIT